jgi:DNA-binding NarL/FixJ family response regulator
MKPHGLRVVIGDDETHIRYVIKDVAVKEGFRIVGEACDGIEALEMYRRLKPDLLMLDVNMPRKNGDEVLSEVLKEFPGAQVVMLTMVADAGTVSRCIGAGAIGYILKSNPTEEIRGMLREIAETIMHAEPQNRMVKG